MKKWSDSKTHISSISDVEKKLINKTASLVAELIQKRLDLGLTQRQLAEISGVKQSAIARLESNGVVPRLDTLFKLLIPLGLSIKLVDEKDSDDVFDPKESS